MMNTQRRLAFWFALLMVTATGAVQAQNLSAPIEDEVRQRLRMGGEINPLPESPFGEYVNLSTGTFGFEQTDVELKGHGPDIKLTRTFSVMDASAPYWRAFQDWSLEIPRIETITTPKQGAFFINSSMGRCTHIASDGPMTITLPPTGLGSLMVGLDAQAWWYGFHLLMPGQGSLDLILPGAQNTRPLPQVTLSGGRVVQAIMFTRNNIAIGCLPSTANGAPGEGFLAITPDGTKYWLDWLVYKRMLDYGKPPQSIVRNLAMMMVSRIEDRFGNSLIYSYDGYGNLTRVAASDGRLLALNYQNHGTTSLPGMANGDPDYRVISASASASDGTARVWNYSYDASSGALARVALPDGSEWSFSLQGFRAIGGDPSNLRMINYTLSVPCTYELHPERALTLTGTITHPSGLAGTFTARNTIRGESYVPKLCAYSGSTPYLVYRNVMSYSALIQKTFSGAGISAQTWTYSYSAPNQSWDADACAKNNSCVGTSYTDVTDPEGHGARYTFSNRFDATEGQLLSTTHHQGAVGSAVIRDQRNTYAAYGTGPWPSNLGRSLGGNANLALVSSLTPLNQSQIVQDGDTYTRQTLAFDEFVQPSHVKRFSSIGSQSVTEEKTTYLNDTRLWVLGLPSQRNNLGTGEVVDKYEYDAAQLTLGKRWHFGRLVMSYAFDGQGNWPAIPTGTIARQAEQLQARCSPGRQICRRCHAKPQRGRFWTNPNHHRSLGKYDQCRLRRCRSDHSRRLSCRRQRVMGAQNRSP